MFFEEYEAVGKEEYSESVEDDQMGANSGMGIQKIKDAIRELPDSYRIILTLVLIEGLDYEEISEMTGEREGALRTRFSRARKMLAERLRKG